MLCLMPDYLEKFVCDGQRCGAQCCRLWTVFVDSGTYEKYRVLPQEKSREIMARLMPGEEGQAPWAFDFGPEQICHFLRGDCLCGIQKEHGESYLSNTCAIYPRKPVNIGGNYRMSLSLSCPLAAELARDAKCGRLVITHLNPLFSPQTLLEEARPVFRETCLAQAGKILSL